jgi:hypothetical protein
MGFPREEGRVMRKHVKYSGDFGCRHLPHVTALLDTIRRHGGTIDRVQKAKQVKIYYRSADNRKLIYVMALTPSDWRAGKNAAARIRQIMMGRRDVTPHRPAPVQNLADQIEH